jgi:hypothetical protein
MPCQCTIMTCAHRDVFRVTAGVGRAYSRLSRSSSRLGLPPDGGFPTTVWICQGDDRGLQRMRLTDDASSFSMAVSAQATRALTPSRLRASATTRSAQSSSRRGRTATSPAEAARDTLPRSPAPEAAHDGDRRRAGAPNRHLDRQRLRPVCGSNCRCCRSSRKRSAPGPPATSPSSSRRGTPWSKGAPGTAFAAAACWSRSRG